MFDVMVGEKLVWVLSHSVLECPLLDSGPLTTLVAGVVQEAHLLRQLLIFQNQCGLELEPSCPQTYQQPCPSPYLIFAWVETRRKTRKTWVCLTFPDSRPPPASVPAV